MRTHSTRLLALIVCAFAACDRLPSTPPQEDATASAIEPGEGPSFATNLATICPSSTVPAGYVVMRYDRSVTCPNYSPKYYNAYLIGQPGSPEVICSISTIPSGWVITTYGYSSICPSHLLGRNRVAIKIPGPREIVCTNSYVPAGYLTVRYAARAACLGGQVKIIQSAVSTATVCSSNTVPVNWIIFAYYRESYCPPGGPEGFNVFKIGPPPAGISKACSVSDIPSGFVIKSYTRDVRCPSHSLTGFNVVAISLPVNGTWACRSQTLPTGWYFDQYSYSPACYSHITGQNQGRLHHN